MAETPETLEEIVRRVLREETKKGSTRHFGAARYDIDRLIYVYVEPTAGNVTYLITPPVGQRWRLLYGTISITTNSTVATRVILPNVVDELGNLFTTLPSSSNIVADSLGVLGLLSSYGGIGMLQIWSGTLAIGDIIIENPISHTVDWVATMGSRTSLQIQIVNGVAGDLYNGVVAFMEIPKI